MSDFENRLRAAMTEETLEVSARSALTDDTIARGARIRRRRRAGGAIAALALVAVAIPVWRGVDPMGSPIPPTSPTPSHPTHPRSTQQTLTSPPWHFTPVVVAASPKTAPQVVNLRTGQHAGYDRVVIDLSGAMPGYHVSYVPRLIASASGQPVQLQGNAFLSIRLTPATGHDDSGQSVYQGPASAVLSMPALRGAALTEDFEGSVSFGLALSRHAQFRVFSLSAPNRLVVDIRH